MAKLTHADLLRLRRRDLFVGREAERRAFLQNFEGDVPRYLYFYIHGQACAFALLGNEPEACKWLEAAIALDEACREDAREDSDFDGIRESERFKALVQGS